MSTPMTYDKQECEIICVMSLGWPGVSLHNPDTVRQLLRPRMQTHGRSPILFADVGWVERSVGGRKSVGRLVVARQDAGLPPTQAVSDTEDGKEIVLSHIVYRSEIYAVVD